MKRFNLIFILCCVLISSFAQAQLITNKEVLKNMDESFLKQKHLAKNRDKELFGVFANKLKLDEAMALKYLYAYMPLSDLADYNGEFYLGLVRATLKARQETKWGSAIPEDIFLKFVLPPRVNNENLDSFRILKYGEIYQRIKNMSLYQAALEVNHWCHEKVTYKGSDERTSSPLNTMKYSFGRCGEESTFLVAALRTVGIPARQVYTPRWAHTDDNHAWVEVWVGGKWYFLGACEPDPDLNMGWFSVPATRTLLVHTRAYGKYFGNEPLVENHEKFAELNLIGNYAPNKKIKIIVVDESGKPVEKAKVEYQLYNYSEFYPLAKTYTNKKGETEMICGLGDIIVWANKGDAFDYKKITVEKTNKLVLQIKPNNEKPGVEELTLVPPPPGKINTGSEANKAINDLRLKKEDSIRSAYMATFKDSTWGANFAKKLEMDPEKTADYIKRSFGNWREICFFLEECKSKERPWALRMLEYITEKDLRDARGIVLLDHLRFGFEYNEELANSKPDIFANFVLSPRISNELMIDWREYLQSKFEKDFIKQAQINPNIIIDWINKNITLDEESNLHSRAPLTPKGVFDLKVADSKSLDIFFVALCRTFGIPARYNGEIFKPQYYLGDKWINVKFGTETAINNKKGFVHFSNVNPKFDAKYNVNFTISLFKDGVYRSFELDFQKKVSEFPAKYELETGKYMLVTGNRMQDGSVLSNVSFFEVKENMLTEVPVKVSERDPANQTFGKYKTETFDLEILKGGKKATLNDFSKTQGCVMIFVDPDKEPTKHIMAELPGYKKQFEDMNMRILLALSKNRVSLSFNPSTDNLPNTCLYVYDQRDVTLSNIENMMNKKFNTNSFPIICFFDKDGNLRYFSEGYTINFGESLLKTINGLKK